MNTEELKRKAGEHAKTRADSDASKEAEIVLAYMLGHQLALEGASEGFAAWATKEGPNELCHFDGSSEAEKVWQARSLLAARQEGELLKRIEKLREALGLISKMKEGFEEDNYRAIEMADAALAADKGESHAG